MAYRTLLAHLPFEDGADDVLDVATALAERHAGHLIGLHVKPPLDLPMSYDIPFVVTREFEARRDAVGVALAERFAAATGSADFVAEWRVVDDVAVSTEQVLRELGATADLFIAAMAQEPERRGSRHELSARVLAGCGRPMLLIPPGVERASVGERVFVAWDGQRAATRALFGALPLMRRADTVRLQRMNAPGRDRHHALGATEELANTLARHGVTVEIFHADARESEIGRELLGFATDWGADVVVSGSQEQSAMREFVFGSTTRYLFEHVKVPVLTSA